MRGTAAAAGLASRGGAALHGRQGARLRSGLTHPLPLHATHATPCLPARAAVLLVKGAKAWQAQHGGLPGSTAERAAFKDLLRSWQRHVIDGVPLEARAPAGWAGHLTWTHHQIILLVLVLAVRLRRVCPAGSTPDCRHRRCPNHPPSRCPQEENFTEAVANAHKVWAPPTVSPELRAVLADPAAQAITHKVGGAGRGGALGSQPRTAPACRRGWRRTAWVRSC